MTITRIITAAALLSLAAAGAPTASARPAYDPPTAANQTPTSVYSRPDKSMVPAKSPSTGNGDTASSPALPTALPRISRAQIVAVTQSERQAAAYAPPSGLQFSNAETKAYADNASGHISPGVIAAGTSHNGFDWGDAGIGAAGGVALTMLILGAGMVISQRRPRRSRHITALPS